VGGNRKNNPYLYLSGKTTNRSVEFKALEHFELFTAIQVSHKNAAAFCCAKVECERCSSLFLIPSSFSSRVIHYGNFLKIISLCYFNF